MVKVHPFFAYEHGLTSIECGLIVAFLSAGGVVLLEALGHSLSDLLVSLAPARSSNGRAHPALALLKIERFSAEKGEASGARAARELPELAREICRTGPGTRG